MKYPREVADRLHRLDAMRARLAPFVAEVRDFERTPDELAALRKSRKGTKAERDAKAAALEARAREAWPLVERVLRSQLLIKKLYDTVLESEGAQFDFERAEHVDSLWREIRAIRELAPQAERGERSLAGRRAGGKATAKANKSDARARDARIKSQAEALLEEDPRLSNRAIAETLADRGMGGVEYLRKVKLPKLLKGRALK